jgi:hypothetical protein
VRWLLPGCCPVAARFLPGSCPVPVRFLPDGRAGSASVGQDPPRSRAVPAQEPGSNRPHHSRVSGAASRLCGMLPRHIFNMCGEIWWWVSPRRVAPDNFGAFLHHLQVFGATKVARR